MEELKVINPYLYPDEAHQRRHGPTGYRVYSAYMPWLKDEFLFRCVYCLKRMAWSPTDQMVVDHVVPRARAPERECDYDNLVLACSFCNSMKGDRAVPDPCEVAYGKCLSVKTNGKIVAHSEQGERIIKAVRLDHKHMVSERSNQIQILKILAEVSPTEYVRRMTFPADLPDLSRLKPASNSRCEGLDHSWFARRTRNELPPIY